MYAKDKKKKSPTPTLDINTILVPIHCNTLELITREIHGDDGIEDLGDLAPPIRMATTFENNGENLVYSRAHLPTRTRVEKLVGALEGGKAVVYPSGTAATTAILMHYNPTNVWINDGYKGTHHTLEQFFKIKFPGTGYEHIRKLKSDSAVEKRDIVWVESPKNPMCDIEDIKALSKIARDAEAYCVVDSTFASPILQKPLELGAHVVMHSATKFLAGHSDVLCGILVCAEERDGFQLIYERTNSGAVMDLRVTRQSQSSIKVAKFLSKAPEVEIVWHPSLPSHPGYKLCKEQMKGPPPILSLQLKAELVTPFLSHLKLVKNATSLGGVHTTIDWRYPYDNSLHPGLLRLSVGIEGVDDIINDVKQALAAAVSAGNKPKS